MGLLKLIDLHLGGMNVACGAELNRNYRIRIEK